MADNLAKIRKEVAKGLQRAGLTRAATLVQVSRGSRDPSSLSAGPVTSETTVACRGLVIVWRKQRLGGTDVVAGDRVVMLLGLTLGDIEPKIGDKITIESKTSRIIDIERDPAAATFSCLTRA